MNGCAPGLALIERLKATRKWAIVVRPSPFFFRFLAIAFPDYGSVGRRGKKSPPPPQKKKKKKYGEVWN